MTRQPAWRAKFPFPSGDVSWAVGSGLQHLQRGGVAAYGQQRALRRDCLRSPYSSRLGIQRHEQA